MVLHASTPASASTAETESSATAGKGTTAGLGGSRLVTQGLVAMRVRWLSMRQIPTRRSHRVLCTTAKVCIPRSLSQLNAPTAFLIEEKSNVPADR